MPKPARIEAIPSHLVIGNRLANAFCAMESEVCDVANAALVLELIMDETFGHPDRVDDLNHYRLTDEEEGRLYYALGRLLVHARQLRKRYYDEHDQATAAAGSAELA
jgi:hypothetical protein